MLTFPLKEKFCDFSQKELKKLAVKTTTRDAFTDKEHDFCT